MAWDNSLIVLFNYFILYKELHFFKFYYLVCVKKKVGKKSAYGCVNPSNSNSNSNSMTIIVLFIFKAGVKILATIRLI